MPFPKSKDDKVTICVLLDGLGYDLVQRISFLNDLFDEVLPLKTVFGYSCAAQPSILTGLMPTGHGGLCTYYRSSRSIFSWIRLLGLLPRRLRKNILNKSKEITRRIYRITGYFDIWKIPYELLPHFQFYELKSFYSRNPINGISTILDEVRDQGLTVSSYHWNTSDDQIFGETEEKLAMRKAVFHYLYISKTDHLLHINGNDPVHLKNSLSYYANNIRQIYKVAKENFKKVELLVFSDHGMIDVTDKIDVMSHLNKLPYRFAEDYLVFYDATMVRLWFKNPTCKEPIMNIINNINGIELISDNELKKLGSLFPDYRYGESIYLAKGGNIISPSFFGDLDVKGMHGYHPQEPGYEAFVGSSNVNMGKPKQITDLYWIIRHCVFGRNLI